MKTDKTPKIHVVDDDLAMRFALDSILRSVGYEVALYENGLDLIEEARRGIAGCILLDVRLPGPGGLEIQRRLLDMGCTVPIIFLTGHGDVPMAVKAMKAHAVEFMTKPFREQDLLDAIGCAMEAAHRHARETAQQEQVRCRMDLLSARERQIFGLLCQGRLGKQIAYDLNVSEATVKVHRRNLMQKLGVSSISQLILQFGAFAEPARLAA